MSFGTKPTSKIMDYENTYSQPYTQHTSMSKEIKEMKEMFEEILIRKSLEWETKYLEVNKRCERLEKELKRNNIIIFGVNPPEYGLVGFVLDIINKHMDLGMNPRDVNQAYVVGPPNKKTIVVSLVSYIKKEEILNNIRKLRGSGITIAEEVGYNIESKESNARVPNKKQHDTYEYKTSNNKKENNGSSVYEETLVKNQKFYDTSAFRPNKHDPRLKGSDSDDDGSYEEERYERIMTRKEYTVDSDRSDDEDFEKQINSSSAATEPKTCAQCKTTITGGILTALGKAWHPEHFCCGGCNQPITETQFHTNEGKPYCSPCHIKLFAKTCHACDQPILDKCVQAMGANWHEDHFVCGGCKSKLIGTQFMDVEGAPFCQKCYLEKHAARCKGCNKPIADKAVIALDAKWHQMCFRCSKCSKPITSDQSFQVDGGKPCCVKC